jgi:hypothetical protein
LKILVKKHDCSTFNLIILAVLFSLFAAFSVAHGVPIDDFRGRQNVIANASNGFFAESNIAHVGAIGGRRWIRVRNLQQTAEVAAETLPGVDDDMPGLLAYAEDPGTTGISMMARMGLIDRSTILVWEGLI